MFSCHRIGLRALSEGFVHGNVWCVRSKRRMYALVAYGAGQEALVVNRCL